MNPIAEETSDGTRLRNNNELPPCQSISNSGGPQILQQRDDDPSEGVSNKDNKKAWCVCLAGFLVQVIVIGNLHVFGIYFISFLKEFKSSKATTGNQTEINNVVGSGLSMQYETPSRIKPS